MYIYWRNEYENDIVSLKPVLKDEDPIDKDENFLCNFSSLFSDEEIMQQNKEAILNSKKCRQLKWD